MCWNQEIKWRRVGSNTSCDPRQVGVPVRARASDSILFRSVRLQALWLIRSYKCQMHQTVHFSKLFAEPDVTPSPPAFDPEVCERPFETPPPLASVVYRQIL